MTTKYDRPLKASPNCPHCRGMGFRQRAKEGYVPCLCPVDPDWEVNAFETGARLLMEGMLNEGNPYRGKRGEGLWLLARQLDIMGLPHEYPSGEMPEGYHEPKGILFEIEEADAEMSPPRVYRSPRSHSRGVIARDAEWSEVVA